MRIADALSQAQIDRVDAEALLSWVLRCDRAYLHAHPELTLHGDALDLFQKFALRRREGEPVAYIKGEREFYGRRFMVDRRVHIPRPSTENLVALALEFLEHPRDMERDLEPGIVGVTRVLKKSATPHVIVDVGTGSGCIAITMALERQDLRVIATDASRGALDVARLNAEGLGAAKRIEFLQGDLLEPLKSIREPFVVLSNPPYLSRSAIDARPDLSREPRMALDGGLHGSETIAQLLSQARSVEQCVGLILECGVDQVAEGASAP
jgi:release factor glutamine methyltransferase